jgi:hypothetical protein
MATAIIRSYIPEGFVIAADGRKRYAGDPSQLVDTTQKIFDLGPGVAASFTGEVELTPEGSPEVVFDFRAEILSASADLKNRIFPDLRAFGLRLAAIVSKKLSGAVASGKVANFPERPSDLIPNGSHIASVLLDGFYSRNPQRVKIAFWHIEQELQKPKISDEDVFPGHRLAVGSSLVYQALFFSEDPRLAAYRKRIRETPSLKDLVELCRNYVLACSDPVAIEIDPKCSDIGGHVHVATITREEGFRWAIPPLSALRESR